VLLKFPATLEGTIDHSHALRGVQSHALHGVEKPASVRSGSDATNLDVVANSSKSDGVLSRGSHAINLDGNDTHNSRVGRVLSSGGGGRTTSSAGVPFPAATAVTQPPVRARCFSSKQWLL
jgi:hypothetical protein